VYLSGERQLTTPGYASAAIVRSFDSWVCWYLSIGVCAVGCRSHSHRKRHSMPRFSKRVQFIRHLHGPMSQRVKERVFRSIENESDDDSMEDAKDEALTSLIPHCKGKRHLFRPKTNRKGRPDRFSDDLPSELPTDADEAAAIAQSANEHRWLNDDEFLQKCCMSRFAFDWVLDQIEDCQVFTTVGNKKEGRPKAPVSHQLMVFLKCIGTEGSGTASKNQRNMFGIGEGTLDVCRDRVMTAIRKLKPICSGWPNK